jgi:fumarylpyruvate hydrolase
MASLFNIPPAPIVEVAGRDSGFPVRRIFCVGRNYAAHAREMGADERELTFFFTKFAESVVPSGGLVPYPPMTSDFHHEAELVIAIGKDGSGLSPDDALDIVFGYATGLDMTRRDLQFVARDKGRPWDMGKNFARSAPIGAIHAAADIGHPTSGALRLTVNGEVRQQADLADLIWSCAEIVSHLSRYAPLHAGDLIYTGTPAGVGAVVPGDELVMEIEGLSTLRITIGDAAGG